jgi:hypothetical protein
VPITSSASAARIQYCHWFRRFVRKGVHVKYITCVSDGTPCSTVLTWISISLNSFCALFFFFIFHDNLQISAVEQWSCCFRTLFVSYSKPTPHFDAWASPSNLNGWKGSSLRETCYCWEGWDCLYGTAAATGAIVRPPDDTWVNMDRWNNTDRGNRKNSYRNLSHCFFFHHKSQMDCPGCEPGPPRWEVGD